MNDAPPDPLVVTLHILADAARELEDPWLVFGGTAVILAGLDDLYVPDVDVMASPRDAQRLIEALHGRAVTDPGEGLFRSRIFGQILTTPVPIDVMGQMEVRSGADWSPVVFETRWPVEVQGVVIPIPTIAEQIAVCRLFGRSKDLQRAERLETLMRRQP